MKARLSVQRGFRSVCHHAMPVKYHSDYDNHIGFFLNIYTILLDYVYDVVAHHEIKM